MADKLFLSCLDDVARGNIDFDTDSFKVMLCTSSFSPNSTTMLKRSDITNEVVGTGYTAGGTATTVTVTKDTGNNRINITFSNPSWTTATITAQWAVIYKSRGGAASADELVSASDFGSSASSTGGTFTVTFTIPLRLNNSNP